MAHMENHRQSATETSSAAADTSAHISHINLNLENDWKVLGQIYEWLRNGQAFPAQSTDDAAKIV